MVFFQLLSKFILDLLTHEHTVRELVQEPVMDSQRLFSFPLGFIDSFYCGVRLNSFVLARDWQGSGDPDVVGDSRVPPASDDVAALVVPVDLPLAEPDQFVLLEPERVHVPQQIIITLSFESFVLAHDAGRSDMLSGQ